MRSWDPLEVPKRMDVEPASATSLQPFRSADACRETRRWHAEVGAVENCERTAVIRRVIRHSTCFLLPEEALRLRGRAAVASEFVYLLFVE